MANRVDDLDAVLRGLVSDYCGKENVYFQPPKNIRMNYPCVVYERSSIRNRFADDIVYSQNDLYELTVIDHDPDSPLVRSISKLSKCRYERHYVASNLNHDVFTIFI